MPRSGAVVGDLLLERRVVGLRRAQRGHLLRELRALGERAEVEAAVHDATADLLVRADEAALVEPGDAHAALALRGGGADAVPADRLRFAVEVHEEGAVHVELVPLADRSGAAVLGVRRDRHVDLERPVLQRREERVEVAVQLEHRRVLLAARRDDQVPLAFRRVRRAAEVGDERTGLRHAVDAHGLEGEAVRRHAEQDTHVVVGERVVLYVHVVLVVLLVAERRLRRELEGRGEIGDAAADATAADDDVLELWKQVAVFREQMPLT